MQIKVQRDKSFIFSMYKAAIVVDGATVAKLNNGESATLQLAENATTLKVRSGPYKSRPFDLRAANGNAIIEILPQSKFGGGMIAIFAVIGVVLTRLFDVASLLLLLLLAILLDLTLFRTKWTVREIS